MRKIPNRLGPRLGIIRRTESLIEEASRSERDILPGRGNKRDGDEDEIVIQRSSNTRSSRKRQIPASLHPERSRNSKPFPQIEDDGENPLPPAIESDITEDSADAGHNGPGKQQEMLASRGDEDQGFEAVEEQSTRQALLPKRDLFAQDAVPPAHRRLRDSQVTMASANATLGRAEFFDAVAPAPINRPARSSTGRMLRPALPLESAAKLFDLAELASAKQSRASERVSSGRSSRSGSQDSRSQARAKQLKWGDIARAEYIPLDDAARDQKPDVQRALHAADSNSDAMQKATGTSPRHGRSLPEAKISPSGVSCRYDAANRRLHDFQLPDAQGRFVSLKDFDSELILLDFWGSWCVPCKTSLPQWVALQNRLGSKKLQVIGIACERATANKRPKLVARSRSTGSTIPC